MYQTFIKNCGALHYDIEQLKALDKMRIKDFEWKYQIDELCDGYVHYKYNSQKGGVIVRRNIFGSGVMYCPDSLKGKEEAKKKEIEPEKKIFTFETYDMDYNANKEKVNDIKNFPLNPDLRIMYIYGTPKIGKTHLAKALQDFLYRRGHDVFFVRAEELADVFKNIAGGKEVDEYKSMLESDFLIIDDLGREPNYPSFPSAFINLIETYPNKIVITSELAISRLALSKYETYANKIINRLSFAFVVSLTGKPYEK